MDPTVLEEFRQRLLAEQARLEQLLQSARRDVQADQSEEYNEAGGVAAHQADVATSVYEREQALSLARDFEHQLAEIRHALQKIAAGTYGYSEQSGAPIPLERLRAIPWARYTIEEERELERQRGS
ncbi:MAG: hypothetical protein KatS3mg061_2732 [Dehalococcoidia bacterium]|nr:MAG: hypothetical protein KatS3mg061_2732 [Dehalococcoidia bacterium]